MLLKWMQQKCMCWEFMFGFNLFHAALWRSKTWPWEIFASRDSFVQSKFRFYEKLANFYHLLCMLYVEFLLLIPSLSQIIPSALMWLQRCKSDRCDISLLPLVVIPARLVTRHLRGTWVYIFPRTTQYADCIEMDQTCYLWIINRHVKSQYALIVHNNLKHLL